MKNLGKPLEFADLFLGMILQDENGNTGVVKKCENIQSVQIEWDLRECIGIYTLDSKMPRFKLLFAIDNLK